MAAGSVQWVEVCVRYPSGRRQALLLHPVVARRFDLREGHVISGLRAVSILAENLRHLDALLMAEVERARGVTEH